VATIVFADLIGTDDVAADASLRSNGAPARPGLHRAVLGGGFVNQYSDGVMALFSV
jgi:hypothetical protein